MKNIVILGASRAGKSTLTKMICEKYPNYNVIIGDAVRKAFSEILPQNNINNNNGSGMIEDFPKFLAYMFYRSIKICDRKFNYIIDSCDILPEKAKELFEKEDTIIIFLGFPKLTEEEHFYQIKQYQKNTDWTYNKDDDFMKEHVKRWIAKSKYFEKKCKELDIWFVDTSFDREKVLNDTMQILEKIIM